MPTREEHKIQKLETENAELRASNPKAQEGAVVNRGVPDVPRSAFGKDAVTFKHIRNHNWRIERVVLKEKKERWIPEENAVVKIEKTRVPATMFTITIVRNERDNLGVIAPRERSITTGFPFYTFDNDFTKIGVEPKDVALAIWNMREMWGRTINVYQMTDAEVSTYYQDRLAPEQIAARERMAVAMEETVSRAKIEPLVRPLES